MLHDLKMILNVAAAILFGISFMSKTQTLDDFKYHLHNYRFIPVRLAAVAAYAVLAAELLLALLLAGQWFSPWPEVAAIVMLVAFSAGLAFLAKSKQNGTCACFGSIELLNRRPLLRNAVLVAALLISMWLPDLHEGLWSRMDAMLFTATSIAIAGYVLVGKQLREVSRWKPY
ncbi:MauE/DoxX family redox-associated membrane protein [Paenibacillus sp. MMS18-CY102]|uniref:MauE/DoxX family redox-associated membrane protein n=1 Tax=Paenibacillus sp. MMS18-CY102 TaxID=2682849 RepID=UPI001F2635FC|nr:MauE/DoxX family redox-associated membrane protein [Paenibacillus sp. MMS18-CY102]